MGVKKGTRKEGISEMRRGGENERRLGRIKSDPIHSCGEIEMGDWSGGVECLLCVFLCASCV